MARVELASLGTGVAQNPSGAVVPGAAGTIVLHNTSTPVLVWSAETGGTSTSGTFVTDSFGRIPGWIDAGQRVDITIPPAPVITADFGDSGGEQLVNKDQPNGYAGLTSGGLLKTAEVPPSVVTDSRFSGGQGGSGLSFNSSAVVLDSRAVDVYNSVANPGSVTDWGPTINTLISNGYWNLFFGAAQFPFHTQLNLSNTQGVKLHGTGGNLGIVLGRSPSAQLIWTGTGSGSPVNLANNDGLYVSDLGIFYNNSGFTGDLWDNNLAYGTTLERCRLGSIGYLFSAFSCVAMSQAVNCTLRDCAIGGDGSGTAVIGGAQIGVAGRESGDSFSNVVTIDNCIIGRSTTAQVTNPYQAWTFNNVTWELLGSPAAILTNLGITSNFNVIGGWLGDTTSAISAFQSGTTDVWHATFIGVYGGSGNAPVFSLQGGGSIAIIDCPLNRNDSGALVDLGSIGGGAVRKSVRIKGGGWVTNTEAILNRAGHRLTIQETGDACKTVDRLSVAGHENVSYKANDPCVPAIAANANLGTSPTVTIRGSDRAGQIILTPGAGNAAGIQATVTFGTAYEADSTNSQTVSASADIPLVELFPIDWGGFGRGVLGNFYNAQIGARYASNGKTSFDIESNVALAGSVCMGYRVIQI